MSNHPPAAITNRPPEYLLLANFHRDLPRRTWLHRPLAPVAGCRAKTSQTPRHV